MGYIPVARPKINRLLVSKVALRPSEIQIPSDLTGSEVTR